MQYLGGGYPGSYSTYVTVVIPPPPPIATEREVQIPMHIVTERSVEMRVGQSATVVMRLSPTVVEIATASPLHERALIPMRVPTEASLVE